MPAPTTSTPAAPASVASTNTPVGAKPAVADVKTSPDASKTATNASSGAEDSWEVSEGGKTVKKTRKEIIEAYQLRQLSDKKRSEADKVMSDYQKAFTLLKQDPIKFLNATGLDFDQLSTSYLAKKAEEAMMDPKEREFQKTKAEADQLRKWKEEQEKAKVDSDKKAAIEGERSRIHQEIIGALESAKELGLPVDEELVVQIAQKMLLQDKKQRPLDAKEALPKAYESTQKFLKGIASKMEGDALVKWLGDDVVKKIRKYDLATLKKKLADKGNGRPQDLVTPKKSGEAKKPQYQTWSQFKERHLDKIV